MQSHWQPAQTLTLSYPHTQGCQVEESKQKVIRVRQKKVNRIVYSHTIINSFVKECDNFSREANPIPPRRSHTEWLLALALAESFSARQNTCRRGSLVCFGRSTIRSYHTRGGARSYHWPWPRTERVRLFADAYPVSVTLGAISWVE